MNAHFQLGIYNLLDKDHYSQDKIIINDSSNRFSISYSEYIFVLMFMNEGVSKLFGLLTIVLKFSMNFVFLNFRLKQNIEGHFLITNKFYSRIIQVSCVLITLVGIGVDCTGSCKKSLKIPKGGNQNPYIKEEQTTQWPKENKQKDKQRSTKHTHKTKDGVTRNPLKNRGELRCFEGVGSSCSTQ